MPDTRPDLTGHPVALFVFSNLREQKGGLTRAWLRRLSVFHEAGWDTHVATIHPQPEIDETLAGLAASADGCPRRPPCTTTSVGTSGSGPRGAGGPTTTFTRDDRVADWLDWLVGRLPGVVVFADSPVTYAPVAMMRNPYVGRVMTVHLAHRKGGIRAVRAPPVRTSRRVDGRGRSDRATPARSASPGSPVASCPSPRPPTRSSPSPSGRPPTCARTCPGSRCT